MSARVYRIGTLALLLSWVAFVFLGLCRIPDFRFDDPYHFKSNARTHLPVAKAMKEIWTDNRHAYTPLTLTLWWGLQKVVAKWGNFQPVYATNVALHLMTTLVVLFLLLELGFATGPAFWGALLFGLHPVHVEPVAWLTGMRDVLSSLLGLASLLLYLKWAKSNRTGILCLSGIVFLLAVFAKQNIAFFWLSFPFFALPWKKLAHQKAAFAMWLSSIPILLHASKPNDDTSAWLVAPVPFLARFLVALDTITFYLAKGLFPFELSFDYGRTPSRVLASREIFFTMSLPLILYFWLKKFHLRTLGLAFVCALFPALGFVPFIHQHISTVADRYAYVAIFSLAVVVAMVIRKYARLQWLMFGLAVVFSMRSLLQVVVWSDRELQYRQMVEVTPKSWLGHNSLGTFHAGRGEVDDAIREFRLAIAGQDELKKKPEMLNVLGTYLLSQERSFEALGVLQTAIELRPAFAKAHHNLGIAWMRLGAMDKAQESFWEALTFDPKISESREGLKEISRLPQIIP